MRSPGWKCKQQQHAIMLFLLLSRMALLDFIFKIIDYKKSLSNFRWEALLLKCIGSNYTINAICLPEGIHIHILHIALLFFIFIYANVNN